MPQEATVRLLINKNTSSPEFDYAMGSDGNEYGYKWLGGNGVDEDSIPVNNGSVVFDVDPDNATVFVEFNGNQHEDYEFEAFINLSSTSQLKGKVIDSKEKLEITDDCDYPGLFKWGALVSIKDTSPKVTFLCDPWIRNRN